ncbi:kinase-like domain-containing protein [Rhodocollybia butyracea]|uniref:Kinase-like domain-containing protein n=1 Tax=Rhodocollybia butyracea TaxID=206335 RepID=A0A9P5Q5U1_9AGAR|nr:kinase-like domain-containing protein [Rhodocollybia butyracea]
MWSSALAVDNSRILKFSSRSLIHEVLAMELIRDKTDIPVATPLMTFSDTDEMFIVMTVIPGEPLSEKWSSLSGGELADIANELIGHIESIRSLGASLSDGEPLIGAWPVGPLRNVLFDPPSPRPFSSSIELRTYWEQRLKKRRSIRVPQQTHVVLTHGDLGTQNILVKDAHIVGIVDWDTFGWYPDYWEGLMFHRRTDQRLHEYKGKILEKLGLPDVEDYELAIREALL